MCIQLDHLLLPPKACQQDKEKTYVFIFTPAIDLSHNDVKCGFEMLHETGLALEKCRANHIQCNMNLSAFDVIIRKAYFLLRLLVRSSPSNRCEKVN